MINKCNQVVQNRKDNGLDSSDDLCNTSTVFLEATKPQQNDLIERLNVGRLY